MPPALHARPPRIPSRPERPFPPAHELLAASSALASLAVSPFDDLRLRKSARPTSPMASHVPPSWRGRSDPPPIRARHGSHLNRHPVGSSRLGTDTAPPRRRGHPILPVGPDPAPAAGRNPTATRTWASHSPDSIHFPALPRGQRFITALSPVLRPCDQKHSCHIPVFRCCRNAPSIHLLPATHVAN